MALAETPPDARAEFLQALALTPAGRVVIANLAIALRQEARLRTTCAHCLGSCAADYAAAVAGGPRDGTHALKVFRKVAERDHDRLFFQAPLATLPPAPIGVVVCASLFFPQSLADAQKRGSLFFPPEYFRAPPDRLPVLYRERSAEPPDSGLNEDELARLAADIEEALDNAPRRAGAPQPLALGRGCYAVFVTRTDREAWVSLCESARSRKQADGVRDHLGVPWWRGEVLVELRVRRPLDALARDGRKVARPTAFEAWRHDYFRHRAQPAAEDDWGWTVDFSRLAEAAAGAPVEGAPELVLDMLPLEPVSGAVEVDALGEIGGNAPAKASLERHLECLLRGRTIEEEIAMILGHLAEEAA